ncbi:MAG: hypothetical protein QOI91_768 [Solirubrobacteraceae bacterium]|nr:hypothetical protein [Solirubrobacteraceae bacterium]MDX6670405.1 hypothetical protein [Solirubrobacteraceae bacterium]
MNTYHDAAVDLDFQFPTQFLGSDGQRAGFLLLAGFLGSWLFIRTSARMIRAQVSWWPGNVQTKSGLHIHHLVWGICLILLTGFLGFALQPPSPFMEILAVLFGVGAGLTLDEFALWVHLQDVYWTQEGRSSVDAVVIALVFGGMVVAGAAPWDVENAQGSVTAVAVGVGFNLVWATLSILKGKPWMGLIGLFLPPVAVIGAIRLAKPHSPWARRFYKPDGQRLARARERWTRLEAHRHRALNVLAGAPSKPDPDK